MTRVASVELKRWNDVERPAELISDIEAVFFGASATTSFADQSVKDAFRERWLGRYLVHDAPRFYVALAGDRAVGYLAGCLDDPARTPRFADLWYFAELADLTRLYPAHLHVNLHPDYRHAGIGGRLIDRFAADVEAASIPGVHVVTGASSRNRSFYARNNFAPLRELSRGEQNIVFLGRRLPAQIR